MKKLMICGILFICTLGFFSCGNSEGQGGTSMATFSYQDDLTGYQQEQADMKTASFFNTDSQPIESQADAEKLAAGECSISYSDVSVYFDSENEMWRVDFFTAERDEQGRILFSGDYQSVYLSADGITQLVVTRES